MNRGSSRGPSARCGPSGAAGSRSAGNEPRSDLASASLLAASGPLRRRPFPRREAIGTDGQPGGRRAAVERDRPHRVPSITDRWRTAAPLFPGGASRLRSPRSRHAGTRPRVAGHLRALVDPGWPRPECLEPEKLANIPFSQSCTTSEPDRAPNIIRGRRREPSWWHSAPRRERWW